MIGYNKSEHKNFLIFSEKILMLKNYRFNLFGLSYFGLSYFELTCFVLQFVHENYPSLRRLIRGLKRQSSGSAD